MQLGPHAFVVFVPLVKMTEANGATNFKPGSHTWARRADGSDEGMETVTFWPDVGSVTIWDYRLLHRGRRNLTVRARPCLYLAPAKEWYADDKNKFPSCSIFNQNPGQGMVPERLQPRLPSFLDMLDCDPNIGSDYSSDESND